METDENKRSSTRGRWRRRGLRLVKALRYLVVLAILLAALYVILDQITWRRVVSQRAEFAERFGVVSTDGANPEMPSAEEDAGRYYRYAWSLIAETTDLYGGFDPHLALRDPGSLAKSLGSEEKFSPEVVEDYVRRKLAAAQPGLDVALEAAGIDHGILSLTNDPEVLLSALSEARGLARYLCARAVIAARDGDTALALSYLRTVLHLASTVGESRTLIAQLVQIAIVGIVSDSAQHVLDMNDATGESAAAIAKESRKLRNPDSFVRTLAGESLFMRDRLYDTMPRLWAALNELRMTEVLIAMADAVKTEDADLQRELLAHATETAEQGPALVYAIAQITAPALLRSVEAWDRMVAQTTLMEVGLALSQYHAEHGEYPETLEAAATYLDGAVPGDPYTGTPLVYERRGEGYVLYSVGPNLNDDGGTPLDGPGGIIGDVLWSIGQPEPEPQAEAQAESVPAGRQELPNRIQRLRERQRD